MNKSLSFVFNGHESDFEKGQVIFSFSFKGEKNIDFKEKISFPPVSKKIPRDLLKSLLDNLMLILGISYWKLYCPKEIVIKKNFLTKEQAKFWNTVYTKGLGEFYYKNKIDFRGLVNFPFTEKKISLPSSFPRKNRSLVGIGGGKDSIVSAEILRITNKEFDLVTSGFPIQIEVANLIGKKVINTKKYIDPKLLEMNSQKDTYNGHIPISVYYAFLLVLMAALFDYRYVIVSNERSANEGNVEYLGQAINHQWSKSFEFEKIFSNYVKNYISKDIYYFSLLRSFSEIKIAQIFSNYKKYFSHFTSCNRNFSIASKTNKRWCGSCPKCIFVFSITAAFLSKKEVISIFGKNLFEDKKNLSLFRQLLGIEKFKPFACVGTKEEMQHAMHLVYEKEEFSKDLAIRMFENEVLPKDNIRNLGEQLFSEEGENLIPEEFKNV